LCRLLHCVYVAGKMWGEPEDIPVIALHGWRDNAGSFDPLAQLLKFNFLALEIPGHGLSTHTPMGLQYHWPDSIFFLRYVVKHLGYKKVSLMGHSLGSTISYAYAGLYPDEVHKYVSIECGRSRILTYPKDTADSWGETIDSLLNLEEKMLQQQSPEYTSAEIAERQQKGAFMSPTLKSAKILLKRGSKQSPSSPDKYTFTFDPRIRLDAFKRPSSETMLALCRRIKCPILNIYGNPGMNVKMEKEYEESLAIWAKTSAKLEVHEVPGSHHLHINNPEKIAPLINDFMAS
jgi:pimeloyl-ACP methyl ester carboxylesterase